MNSNWTRELPATSLGVPVIFSKKEVLRTRPPPEFLQVLIVDNDKHRGEANARTIENLGHSVELAGNGITALRKAAANRPDVVLLNTKLGDSDDCDVTGHLRSDYPVLPPLIIGLASHASSFSRWRCVNAGMDLVLETPLNATTVETLLLFESAKLTGERKRNWQNDPARALLPTQRDGLPSAYSKSTAANNWLEGMGTAAEIVVHRGGWKNHSDPPKESSR